jgi:HEAT repeat protein
MTRLRRSVIWGVGIAAVLTLAAGVVVGWRLVEEEMCIRRLDSSDEGERQAAAARLGAMRSSRAISRLVPLALSGSGAAKDALVEIGAASVPPLLEEVDGSHSPEEMDGRHSPAEDAARWILDRIGREATRAFLAGARHDRKEVRILCVRALLRCLDEGPDVHAALVKALGDPEWEVRRTTMSPLVQAKGRETEVAGLLSERLMDAREEPAVRYEAACRMPALGGPGQSGLRGALKHADSLVQVYAAHSLLYVWPDLEQETVPVLLDGLRSPDWRARSTALDTLSRFDSPSSPRRLTASILKTLLEDPVQEVRSATVRALEDYELTDEMVAPLIAILQAESGALDDAAILAANALGRLGPRAAAVIPALIDCVEKTPHSYMRERAVWALGRVGPAAAPAVPALAAALKNGCCPALDALGSIGEPALEATPVIVEALSNPDCAGQAHTTLVRLLGPRIIPDLLPALRGGDAEVRVRIIEVLGDFGPSAGAAAGDLAAFLKEDVEWEVKVAAARALGRVGPGAAPHADLLLRVLSDSLQEPGTVSAVAAEALGRIGIPEGSSAAPLIDAARSEDHEVRAHALLALGRLKRGDPEIVVHLRNGLADEEPLVRSFSAMGLRDLGLDDTSIAKALPAVFASDEALRLVHAMEGFPEEVNRVLEWLIERLSTGTPDYSRGVIKLIDGLGPEGKVALPLLLELVGKSRGRTESTGDPFSIRDIEELCRRLESGEE